MCCGFSSITLVPEAQTVQSGPAGSPPKVNACLSPGDWVASEHLGNSTMTQDPQPLLFKSHLPREGMALLPPHPGVQPSHGGLKGAYYVPGSMLGTHLQSKPGREALYPRLMLIHPSFMHQYLSSTY